MSAALGCLPWHGFLLRARAGKDWIAAVLLVLASILLFGFFVLRQTPFLWPTILLWAAIVTLLLFGKRFRKVIRIDCAVILVVVSAWYCVSYLRADAASLKASEQRRSAAIHVASN
jgi:hypothetical protein